MSDRQRKAAARFNKATRQLVSLIRCSFVYNSRAFSSTVVMILSFVVTRCAEHHQYIQYIAAALEHSDQAITNGRARDKNALAEQATVALLCMAGGTD